MKNNPEPFPLFITLPMETANNPVGIRILLNQPWLR